MVNHTGWYPPGQVCYPPQLPTYLRNVYDLEPIIGVPSDTEVIGIHAVIQAASKVSGVPGMHDPTLFMGLADHLFGAQMARYRSRYSLVVFPSDATYTPPTTTLPAHISVNLEPVYGAPSDEEIVKAQEAVRSYQQFSHARYMRCAGESQPSPVPQVVAKPESPIRTVNQPSGTSDESTGVTNNAGTGASAATMQAPQFPSSVDVREVMERSNQLTERLATLLERSNELAERPTQSTEDIGSLAERFNQVLERLTQLVENTRQTTAPDPLTERFNQLFERFDRAVEYSDRSAQQANQLAERSNQLIERSNQLAEQLNQPSHLPNHLTARSNQILEQSDQLAERLNQVLGELHPVRRANELSERANQLSEHLYQSFERSNQLAEQANGHAEQLGNVMKNINKVLVGI